PASSPPGRDQVRRRCATLPGLFPARSSRSRLSESRRLPEQLIGVDDFAEARFVAAVAAILVGMISPDQQRIALPERMPVGLLGRHALKEIILGVMLADMVEAQEAPAAWPVEAGRLQWRFIFP